MPVVDGYSFPHLIKRLDIAGQQITSYLLDLLLRRGYAFNQTTDVDSLRQMKERICYVACDYQREVKVYMPWLCCASLCPKYTVVQASWSTHKPCCWRCFGHCDHLAQYPPSC